VSTTSSRLIVEHFAHLRALELVSIDGALKSRAEIHGFSFEHPFCLCCILSAVRGSGVGRRTTHANGVQSSAFRLPLLSKTTQQAKA
jgi:hypothetical protein